MKDAHGKIVNRSSGGAFMPCQHYGITKLVLASMTLSLAQELAPGKIDPGQRRRAR
jgi:short-subunit dehydrogenase